MTQQITELSSKLPLMDVDELGNLLEEVTIANGFYKRVVQMITIERIKRAGMKENIEEDCKILKSNSKKDI